MAEVKGRRRYSSPVRDEQAALTRSRILDAAGELFLERGYARTTVQDMADRAEVARDTVHAVFGSKARVLTALIDTRLVPGDGPANITETPPAQAIRDEVDPRRQIELFGIWAAGVSARLRPVFEILRTASAVEPEMASVFKEMDRYRLKNMQTFARWFAARGPLRVSTERAAEIIWALASPDVARMLCDELGWSEAEHSQWLADTLARALLAQT
ncbi:MAG: helix-turn-helix domain-containing protein [Actinomycetota bacterium]